MFTLGTSVSSPTTDHSTVFNITNSNQASDSYFILPKHRKIAFLQSKEDAGIQNLLQNEPKSFGFESMWAESSCTEIQRAGGTCADSPVLLTQPHSNTLETHRLLQLAACNKMPIYSSWQQTKQPHLLSLSHMPLKHVVLKTRLTAKRPLKSPLPRWAPSTPTSSSPSVSRKQTEPKASPHTPQLYQDTSPLHSKPVHPSSTPQPCPDAAEKPSSTPQTVPGFPINPPKPRTTHTHPSPAC